MVGTSTMPQDREWLDAARAGSTAAFGRLVERYYGMVHAIAYSHAGQRETAEDLAQETFLRAWLCLDQLQKGECFAPWLTRIARNLAGEWRRKGQRRERLASMVPLEERHHESLADQNSLGAEQIMERQEQERPLWEAISRLPAEQREIVLLHYTEGLAKADIAARLGVHPATVGRQIERALHSLRGALEPLVRASAPALRPSRSGSARAALLIASAAALSAETRSALAATAVKSLAVTASGAPEMPVPTGLMGLLKTSAAAAATGGKIMAAAKTWGVVVLGASVLVGAYVLNQQAFFGKQEPGQSAGAVQKTDLREAKEKLFPPEVMQAIARINEKGIEQARASGKNLVVKTTVYKVDDKGVCWAGGMASMLNPGPTVVGKLNLGDSDAREMLLFDDKGNPLRYDLVEKPGSSKQDVCIYLDKPWEQGSYLKIAVVARETKALKPSKTADEYSFDLCDESDIIGVMQYGLSVPKRLRLRNCSEDAAWTERVGDSEILVWSKPVTNGSRYRVTAALRPKN